MQKTVDLATAAFKEIEDLQRHSDELLGRAEAYARRASLENPQAAAEINEQIRRYLNTMQRIVRNANADILSIIKEGL